jgi:hypothetical protein
MSIIDKVKGLLGQHSDKAEKGIDKAGDMIDRKTGGKYSDKIDSAQEKAKDKLGQEPRRDDQPGQGPQPGSGRPPA